MKGLMMKDVFTAKKILLVYFLMIVLFFYQSYLKSYYFHKRQVKKLRVLKLQEVKSLLFFSFLIPLKINNLFVTLSFHEPYRTIVTLRFCKRKTLHELSQTLHSRFFENVFNRLYIKH